jgi:small subunit ribosomal protein S21
VAIRVTSIYGNEGERLLQRFKRLCLRSGLFKELKRRRSYEKPSDRRRREAKERRRATLKAERRKDKDRITRRR